MLSDFEMITHSFDTPITIFPISDVHYGSLEHQADAWADFCKMIRQTPNAYVVLGGDLINNNTRSSVGSPWDDVVRPREQKARMVEFLTPIKDRILCCTTGNHEARSLKDADYDPTYEIMTKLDLEDLYRPNICFMKISLGERERDGSPCQSYTFAVTHGAGNGAGTVLNRNERFGNVIDGLDCLIVGHTHKGTVSKPSKIVINRRNNTVKVSHYTVISMVSWMNYGGYALKKMLLPSNVADPQRLNLSMSEHDKRIEVVW